MSTDDFLHGLAAIGPGLQWAVILLPFVALLALLTVVVVLLVKRRWALAAAGVAAGLLLATPPFFGSYWKRMNASQEHAELLDLIGDREAAAARAAEVATFERTSVNGDYPPVLEVHGSLPDRTIRLLLGNGVFSEVHVYESYRRRPDKRVVHTRNPAPDCSDFGPGYTERSGADRIWTRRLKSCFPAVEELFVDVETPPDAVLYLADGETTLDDPRGSYFGRQELRVRRAGDDRLVDYWEARAPAPARIRVGKARPAPEPAPVMDSLLFIRRGLGLTGQIDANLAAAGTW